MSELVFESTRVRDLVTESKSSLLNLTFDDALLSGRTNIEYIGGDTFKRNDYVNAKILQEKLLVLVFENKNRLDFTKKSKNVEKFLSETSKDVIDDEYFNMLKNELNSDGSVSIKEIAWLATEETPFGSRDKDIPGLVRIGFVDLTAASFNDRNIFDFKINFAKNLKLNLIPAEKDFISNQKITDYDFILVTDLIMAKIFRDFSEKTDRPSRYISGERQVSNPSYSQAAVQYQSAMQNSQIAAMNVSQPSNCNGSADWGCAVGEAIATVARRANASNAKEKMEAAGNKLYSIPQTITQPVFSSYSFQTVRINAKKTYDVDFYLIDVNSKQVMSSNFSGMSQESFLTVYNIDESDPAKDTILRTYKIEEDVTKWENLGATVPLSNLFNEENLNVATIDDFNSVEEFLKPISSRKYTAAVPEYTSENIIASSASTNAVIADERFDSVVVIKNSNSTGTGFYVTPDLILTAYHVVDGSSLVELAFYDGTKSYGKVVDYDARLDLALIRPQVTGKPLKIHTGPIRLGATVEAIGHPKGYEFTISRGVVSAVRKQKGVILGSSNLVEFVQTDTPISPGNSGGPLLLGDAVIGVNDWVRVDKASQNLNFSVSFNEIREYLNKFNRK